MRISDWSADVCSSDLVGTVLPTRRFHRAKSRVENHSSVSRGGRPICRGRLTIRGVSTVAAQSGPLSGIAGRYAAALFDLADERKVLDGVAEDLRSLKRMLDESADLRKLDRSPVIGSDDQVRDRKSTRLNSSH